VGNVMNKKGFARIDDTIMSFILMVIIFVGIMIGVILFYSHTVDIRSLEAEVLADKLIKGIVDNGKLRAGVLDKNFDIFESTGLNKKVIVDSGEYYFKVEIFQGEIVRKFEEGNRDFEAFCFLESKKFPKCVERELFLSSYYEDYKIKILAGANQLGEEV